MCYLVLKINNQFDSSVNISILISCDTQVTNNVSLFKHRREVYIFHVYANRVALTRKKVVLIFYFSGD